MRQLKMRSMLTVAVVAISSLALAQLASARSGPHAHASANAITVKGKEFSLKLSSNSIARPGTVTFTFKNAGTVLHDFKINGKKTPMIRPGKSSRLVVSFRKKGKYPYLCTVPGHAAAGMKGVFSVR